MNYTQLVSAIKGFAENDFPLTAGSFTSTDQIDTFIRQAEQRVYNTVQLPALRKNVTGSTTSGNKVVDQPTATAGPKRRGRKPGSSNKNKMNRDKHCSSNIHSSMNIRSSTVPFPRQPSRFQRKPRF
jgi:hypothetical protein